ncbi:helix-turn-helix domain-containing protein [Patescibacteria group bacterium]|nr:helix-turn-helix domain-containing protein [Patescibacteria group bacterium]
MKQQEALDILKLGYNIYLTGPAGSGKTFLLNKYIKYLKDNGVAVGITASTGIAATHMNGVTIHSWSGLGIRDNLSAKDLRELSKKRYLHKRFAETKILIIDEISMLHSFQLDLIDRVCKLFKQNPLPFGGLQTVLCGDFFQLPPVSKNTGDAHFIDKSEIWRSMNLRVCYLDEQYRHKDSKLIGILNKIRANRADNSTLEQLESRRDAPVAGFSNLTKLYTHNVDVDEINNRELSAIPGKIYAYNMRARGKEALTDVLKKSCLAPEELFLKKGAIVMFVKNNFEQGYVNGTLGKIVDFDERRLPIVQTFSKKQIIAAPASWIVEEDGITRAEIMQIPLRLAWAITVHKSQGMSLDAAEIDLGKSFERGMGYVALSRVRSLDGIKLKGINELALQVNEDVIELDKELKAMSRTAADELKKIIPKEKEQKQQRFLQSVAPPKGRLKKRRRKMPGSTYEETKILVLKKLPIKEIAHRRGMTEGTIMNHLEKLTALGEKLDLSYIKLPAERFGEIKKAFEKTGDYSLSPVREILGHSFSYDELRLARLFLDKD